MKKILTTLAVAGLSVAAFAQGTVNWSGVGGAFVAQTNGSQYSTFVSSAGAAPASGTQGNTLGSTAANNTALGYSGYYFALLIGSVASAPTSVADLNSWTSTGLTSTNAASNNGRTSQVGANNQAIANGWIGGTTTNVIVVGWSANLGTTWAAVLNTLQNWNTLQGNFTGANAAYFGVSAVGTLTAGTGNPGVTVFGASAGQINNSPLNSPAGPAAQLNQLAVVPEPGTLALAALGGASLLLFRRKK